MSYMALELDDNVALVREYVAIRGRFQVSGLLPVELQSLPTDPIGTFNLTLTNLVVGSAIQIESISGTVFVNTTATGSTYAVVLQTYSPGSALNNLKIKVRKGSSSPYYQPYETQTTSVVGSQSIYVSQIPDE